jgi:hypothetical protein
MARALTASERSSLIRLAHTLESGDPLKSAIVGGLQRKAGYRDRWNKRWYGSLGHNGHVDVTFYCEFLSDDLSPRDASFGAEEKREFERVFNLVKNLRPTPKVDFYKHDVSEGGRGWSYSNRMIARVSWPGLRNYNPEDGTYLVGLPTKILESHGYVYDNAIGK